MKHINVSLFVPHLGCPHTCIFCNQKTISGKSEPLKHEDIIRACEIARQTPHNAEDAEIAFFGGSFTAIPRDEMIGYLETAAPFIKDGSFSGIRISTRPDCIDREVLTVLRRYGVTSVELGAQSMDRTVLEVNERGHTPEQTVKAAALIKEYGFSLGLQMMTGLMGSNDKKDYETALSFVSMRPDTVRIYPTVVLENTALCSYYYNGMYTPPGLEESVALCAKLRTLFEENGIRVIRLGLHSGGGVAEGFVAGVYHPAFGELVASRIYRKKAEALLADRPKGAYTLAVGQGKTSQMVGQKRENLIYLKNLGYTVSVKEDTVEGLVTICT